LNGVFLKDRPIMADLIVMTRINRRFAEPSSRSSVLVPLLWMVGSHILIVRTVGWNAVPVGVPMVLLPSAPSAEDFFHGL
jgi:hypothetical protein